MTSLAVVNDAQNMPVQAGESSVFSSVQRFRETQEMAQYLAASDLVPQQFKGQPANCLIALEMSNRLNADPMMVMQNLYIVHGKPAWSSQFLIACVNGCGRFSALQYEFSGAEGQSDWGCVAYATELSTGQIVKGPKVTMAMADAEGWSKKNGSKWKTMPELMLTYRAAAFFARTKAPEVSMGMQTQEEVKDMGDAVVVDNEAPQSVEPAFYSDEDFEANKAAWIGLIETGKKSADDIIKFVSAKATLTNEQKKVLTDAEG